MTRTILLLTAILTCGLPVVALVDAFTLQASGEFAREHIDSQAWTPLFAALTQEFDETEVDNVEEGKQSVSLVFNDQNKDMRLVGTFGPLQANNRSHDAFERKTRRLALTGQLYTAVQRVDEQWYYRRSGPRSNFRAEGALWHTNFPPGPTSDWMGALVLRVPIE